MRRDLAAAALLCVLGAVQMAGWLDPDQLPPYDFAGYVTVAEDVRNQLLRYGEVPDWNRKWFAGTTQHMSTLKERLMLPCVLLLDGLRGVQLSIFLLRLAAALLIYAGFKRCLGAPGAGLVCGYAYAFSTFSSYTAGNVDVVFAGVWLPLIFFAALEMFRRGSPAFAAGLGVLVACQFRTNLVHALIAPLMVLLLGLLRPWERGAGAPGARDPRRSLRAGGLVALSVAVFGLFAASQIAWFARDHAHHAPHDPAYAEAASQQYSEQSPFALLNRSDWLGGWLARHGVRPVERAPEDPLRGQRRYLGVVAIAVCLAGLSAARRDWQLRRSYQLFALLFAVEWNLATGPASLAGQVAQTFRATRALEGPIRAALGLAALACLVWAALRWRTARPRCSAAIGLPLGLAILAALLACPLFAVLRASVPFFAHFRSPGTFASLVPYSFYVLFGLGLVALGRRWSGSRAAAALPAAVLAISLLDFWSGRAAFSRGTPFQPVREFRRLVAALPAGEAEGRIAMSALEIPSLWTASSLVAVNAPLDSSWGWLKWQAGTAALPFFETSSMWLRFDLGPRQREVYARMGEALASIARNRYLLDEFRETGGARLREPWRLRARNDRFALWEGPEVLPMAYAYRAYDLTLGSARVREAFAIGEAHQRGIATIAADGLPAPVFAALLADSERVIRLGDYASASPPSDLWREVLRRFPEKAIDLGAPIPMPRIQAAYRDRAAMDLLGVEYRRPAPGRVQLAVDAGAAPVIAFVSEAYHPWWRARLDGAPAALLQAGMHFMAVRVPPGRHAIELALERPAIVAAADGVSACAWLGLLAVAAAGSLRALRGRRRAAALRAATG